MSDSQPALTIFTPSPRLPAETRCKVWVHAPYRRVRHVTITSNYRVPKMNHPDSLHMLWRPFCATKDSDNAAIPPLVLAGHESRAEVTLLLHPLQNTGLKSTGFYFNLKTDIFSLSSAYHSSLGCCDHPSHPFPHLSVDFRHDLCHLAIKLQDEPELPRIACLFPSFKELGMVLELQDDYVFSILTRVVHDVYDDGKSPT